MSCLPCHVTAYHVMARYSMARHVASHLREGATTINIIATITINTIVTITINIIAFLTISMSIRPTRRRKQASRQASEKARRQQASSCQASRHAGMQRRSVRSTYAEQFEETAPCTSVGSQ